LDVLVVRKLALPGEPGVTIGAVGPDESIALNRRLVADLEVPNSVIVRGVGREQRALLEDGVVYREGRPPLPLRGRVVILVDDGVVTGVTMRAAIVAARAARASRVVAVAPVIAREEYFELRQKADEVVAELIPKECVAVGAYYTRFATVTDEEIAAALGWHATVV
jgi:putative phosphoribosyl transferase